MEKKNLYGPMISVVHGGTGTSGLKTKGQFMREPDRECRERKRAFKAMVYASGKRFLTNAKPSSNFTMKRLITTVKSFY